MDTQAIHERLAHIAAHLERLTDTPLKEPAWLRRTADEPRIPVIIAVLCAIGLQLRRARTTWRSSRGG